jgi:bifunctional non-homologous end joining protein LigD
MAITKKLASRSRPGGAKLPSRYIPPQLCELVANPPVGNRRVHEANLDGFRTQPHVRAGRAILYSRNGLDWIRIGVQIGMPSHPLPPNKSTTPARTLSAENAVSCCAFLTDVNCPAV